ncbi:excalibur calcium-binding domain-containing protein [Cytobacillus praedii]
MDTAENSNNNEVFRNCTELREVYPEGVAEGHTAYATKLDREKDGWACEK